MTLCGDYSGIVLNQNALTTGDYDWQGLIGGNWVYQTFTLPSDYQRGVNVEIRIPDLSGFQVMITTRDIPEVNYTLDYYQGDNIGWVTLIAGTASGVPARDRIWLDVIFPRSVPITNAQLTQQFRFGIQSVTSAIQSLPFVSPTPLLHAGTGQGQVYGPDGFTPLVLTSGCLNFRILALVADNGVNFLNNEYRSCVIESTPGNVGTSDRSYWMSPPMPSRFAVQSLYFDVRPVAESPTYGVINNIGNPSFEYDGASLNPMWWAKVESSVGVVTDMSIYSTVVAPHTDWVADGSQVLHIACTLGAGPPKSGGVTSDFQPVTAAMPMAVSMAYMLISHATSSLQFNLLFYDGTQTLIPDSGGTVSYTVNPAANALQQTLTVPANALWVKYQIVASGTGSFAGYIDQIQVTNTATNYPYFDGDDPGYQWTTQRGNSPSVQLIAPTTDDNSIVIDSIMVDPLTPNMAFNVYFSRDDSFTSDQMSEDNWEQKLWTRVPASYICSQRQEYAFPQPILAKYMKVEFTNLQAQSYDPGNFQKPITYKKFPTWVANFFIMQMELPAFIASHVNVEYDALRFAYDYFLDDLDQAPATPTVPPANVVPQLTDYFNANAITGVDSVTLSKINLVMNTFRDPLGTHVDQTSSLGGFISSLMNSSNAPPTMAEGGVIDPIDYSMVSSLQREALLFEQTLPVMYFFIPCRHGYKEVSASLEYNRAYFAGVNRISFLRNDYTIESDTPLYIESGGDAANVEFSDWVFDYGNSIWTTY